MRHRVPGQVGTTPDRLYRVASRQGHTSPMSRRVCRVVARCAPHTPPARLSIVVRYALWSVLLDDRLDGPGPDRAALGDFRTSLAGVVAARGPEPADPLLRELGGIVDDLAACDPAGGSVGRFGAVLLDAVDTAIAHALLGQAVATGAAAAPTVEDYLPVAARTMNYHSFGYAMLAVSGWDLSEPERVTVDRALGHGAVAVRLANDLRSVGRDRAELTLNVLHLRTAAGDRLTRRSVVARIDEERRRHDVVLASRWPATMTGPDAAPDPAAPRAAGEPEPDPGGMLARSLALAVGVYRRGDLR